MPKVSKVPTLRRLRRLHKILRMYYEKISSFDGHFRRNARRLDLWNGAEFLRDDVRDFECLFDYGRYAGTVRQGSPVEKYFRRHRPPADPEARAVREGMLKARYSIFRVDRVKGLIFEVTDLVRGQKLRFADAKFPLGRGETFAGRLLNMGDFWMAGGPVYAVFPTIAIRGMNSVMPRVQRKADECVVPRHAERSLNQVVARSCIRSGTVRRAEYMGAPAAMSFSAHQ